MEQYISKSSLIAEIKNLKNTYKKLPILNSYTEGLKEGRLIGYKDALDKINTLEVKEIDSIDSFIEKACEWLEDNYPYYFETDIKKEFIKAMKE